MRTVGLACVAAVMAGTAMAGARARAHQDAIPPQFHGDWVAQKATCDSAPARLRVDPTKTWCPALPSDRTAASAARCSPSVMSTRAIRRAFRW